MKRWVVTGGVGFIGHHVCLALLGRGDAVTVLDDFSDSPYPTTMKRRNEAALRAAGAGERLTIASGCITDRALVTGVAANATGTLHLAGLAGVRPSFADPARYARVNVEGTANVLEAAQRAGHGAFVLASSSSVYGNATPLPAREDAAATSPESPYAASKRGAELLAAAMQKKTPDMRVTALRFFTVYGPRQRPEMAITMFLRKILAGEAITVFGDGSMRRDFTHVEDIVRGVLAAADRADRAADRAEQKPPDADAGFAIYNLGSGAPVTLRDLVASMGTAAGAEPRVLTAPVPLGDVDATYADISRARDELGWTPRVSLTEGLASVVTWLRDERS